MSAHMDRHLKRKPTDKKLTPEIMSRLPEARLFNDLQQLETRLDILISRKRLDLQDMIGRSMRKHKTLRIWVSRTVAHQPWQRSDVDALMSDEAPSWTLRVEGRLVDSDDMDARAPRAFSSMLTSLIVELRQDSTEEDSPEEIVEWHELAPGQAPPSEPRSVEFDGMDIRRQGDRPVRAKIVLQLKEYPDKFKLSPPLAAILGTTEESKPGAVVSLWQYIRFHKLQDVDEKRMIKCDDALRNLFKRDTIAFPQLVELLGPHLSPRDPITIDYVIDPQATGQTDVAFDVPIQVDHPLRQYLLGMLNSWHHDTGMLRQLDDLVIQDVQVLNLLAHQRDFYAELADDPLAFLEKWIASQARDLKIIYSDRQPSEEAVRHSSFYDEDTVNQSLHLFMSGR